MSTDKKTGFRISFGTAIALVLGAFMLWMATFMYKALNRQTAMVTSQAWEDGQDYNRAQAARQHGAAPEVKPVAGWAGLDTLTIRFGQSPSCIQGTLRLLRPANQQLDTAVPLAVGADSTMRYPAKSLARGQWRMAVSWTCQGTEYQDEQPLYIP